MYGVAGETDVSEYRGHRIETTHDSGGHVRVKITQGEFCLWFGYCISSGGASEEAIRLIERHIGLPVRSQQVGQPDRAPSMTAVSAGSHPHE